MKIPSKCPKCNSPLLNEYSQSGYDICFKSCNKHPDHNLSIIFTNDNIDYLTITIDLTNNIKALWTFYPPRLEVFKDIFIAKGFPVLAKKELIVLPFFYPDLSKYNEIIEKIKKYIVFS